MMADSDRTITVADEEGTNALARALATVVRAPDIITLSGPLGAGKTAFARALIAAMGGDGEVPSPTFTLAQLYDTPAGTIYHFDLYRLERPEDAFEIGIEDAFADGISLIEWPDKLGRFLPRERLDLTFRIGQCETERHVAFHASPTWADRLDRTPLA